MSYVQLFYQVTQIKSWQNQKFWKKASIEILPITNGLLIFESSLDDCFIETFLPSAPVRAFAVFAGPIPPELTADTLMAYMV